jgi:hypothetical protein
VLVKFSKWMLVATLSLSIGLHWTVLQSVAWCGMVITYSQGASLKEGLAKTFDGKHPCALCKQIAQGRQGEKKSDAQMDLKKLEFLHDEAALAVLSPSTFVFLDACANRTAPLLMQSPPVPPPRSLPG